MDEFTIDRIQMAILDTVDDVILLSESWVVLDIADNEVFYIMYTVHHGDKDSVNSGKTRGGGVVIVVMFGWGGEIHFTELIRIKA